MAKYDSYLEEFEPIVRIVVVALPTPGVPTFLLANFHLIQN